MRRCSEAKRRFRRTVCRSSGRKEGGISADTLQIGAAETCAEFRWIVCSLEGGRLERISADRLQVGRGDNCEEGRRIDEDYRG